MEFLRRLRDDNNDGAQEKTLGEEIGFGPLVAVNLIAVLATLSVLAMLAAWLRSDFDRRGWRVCPTRESLRQEARQIIADAERRAAELRQERKKKKRQRHFDAYLLPYTTVLKESDFVDAPDIEKQTAGADTMDSPVRWIRIASSGQQQKQVEREASCAVCLTDYETGDAVVWAPMDQCQHVFHEECIKAWLYRGNTHCPCCRQEFVPERSCKNKTVSTARESAFSEPEGSSEPPEASRTGADSPV